MTSPPNGSSKPARPLSGSLSSSSPTRPTETATEVLYNTAVQSFVRRDHLKTHASLARLLSTLRSDLRQYPRKPWYTLSPTLGQEEGCEGVEEWLIKTLKLSISAHASLFTDPPSSPSRGARMKLPKDLSDLVPPCSPSKILEKVHGQCLDSYPDRILPPQLASTLILASLKLQPQQDALEYIHKITEDWLQILPDEFMQSIARRGEGRKVESGREGYLKVLELFTGEVLCREGEYEMARGILDGDSLLSGKRKEALYRHLRASQNRREQPSSASSSGILPSPSSSSILSNGEFSPVDPTFSNRSRRSSTTSEDTARPILQNPSISTLTTTNGSIGSGSTIIPRISRRRPRNPKDGKEETDSESTLPSKIFVNSGSENTDRTARPSHTPGNGRDIIRRRLLGFLSPVVGHLPLSWRNAVWGMSNVQLASLSLPLPLFAFLILFSIIRRRQTRRGTSGNASKVLDVGSSLNDVRSKLRAVRGKGLWQWVVWSIKWWMTKVAGVWKMGTTITYV